MGLFNFFSKSKDKKEEERKNYVKPLYYLIENGIKRRVTEKEFLEDQNKREQEIQEWENEYNKDKKIIKIEATRREGTIFIKRLDKREIAKNFSTSQLTARIGTPFNLLSEKPTNGYINLGKPKVTKYLIGNKEVSKPRFEAFQKELNKKLKNPSLTESEKKIIVKDVTERYNS